MKRFFLFFMLLSVCLCGMSQASGEYYLELNDSYLYDRNGTEHKVNLKGLNFNYGGGFCYIYSDDYKIQVKDFFARYTGDGTTQTNDGPVYHSMTLKIGKSIVFVESIFNPADYKTLEYNLLDEYVYFGGMQPNFLLTEESVEYPWDYDARISILFDDGFRLHAGIETVIDERALKKAEGNIMDAKVFVPWDCFMANLVRTWEQSNKKMVKKRQEMCALGLKESKEKKGVAVDLGLSVKWSNVNVGESKPHGNFCTFGWADPTGAKYSDYNEEYPKEKDVYHISGTQYDIASAIWGDGWRIPTKAECEELVAKCRFECLTDGNGDSYVKVTDPNGNHIILPFFSCENYGSYWSGTREDVCCGAFDMTVSLWNKKIEAKVSDENNRFCKFLIRPVHD